MTLVERLRERTNSGQPVYDCADEAADRIEALEAALREAETVMMIVEPRSHKREYLAALDAIRKALGEE